MTWQIPGYAPIRPLGSGASGEVVLARHEETGTSVAIKYLSDELRSDIEHLAAFRAEARLLAGLDDPHIVRLYEYVESGQGAGIVMELVNGPTLRTMLREQGPIEPEAALAVLHGSLLGLAAAHAVAVVHRDYKPENVLIDGDGQSKLADFGIAMPSGATDAASAGTLTYLAPECWRDDAPSPAGDVYAASATFFECMTGHPPFVAVDPAALRRQHANAPIPLDEVPKPLHGIIGRGLAKDPARRAADAAEFARDLATIAAAAYGADWEDVGCRHLSRRAALLSLLWPLPAGAAGTALASTLFGRAARPLAVGGALAVIAFLAISLAPGQPGDGRPVADQNVPQATTSVTPGAATSAGSSSPTSPAPARTASTSGASTGGPSDPVHSGSTTRSATTTASPRSSPSTSSVIPPPTSSSSSSSAPPVQSVKVTIVSFVWAGSMTGKSQVIVSTTTTAAVVLKLNYYESTTSGVPETAAGSDARTLSGSTSYMIIDSNLFSACTAYWVLQAVTIPASSSGTQTNSTSPPSPC